MSNGHLAVSHIRPNELKIHVFALETGQVEDGMKLPDNDIKDCTILPSADAVICRINNQVNIFNIQQKKLTQSFSNTQEKINAIRAHHSFRSLLFVHLKDPRLPLFAKNQPEIRRSEALKLATASFSALSNDGKHLAIGSSHCILTIWQLWG